MEEKYLHLPIIYRLLSIIPIPFFIWCIIFFGLIKQDLMALLIFAFCILFLSLATIMYSVKYIFSEEKIAVKIPFLKIKECYLKDIIGYALFTISSNNVLIIYTNEKHISIRLEGKKIRQEANDFIARTIEIIKNKNLKELYNNGIRIKITNVKWIQFYSDYLEVDNNLNLKKYYYNELIAKCLGPNEIKLVSNENEKIYFNIWMCKGNIGLFEYLINYKWK